MRDATRELHRIATQPRPAIVYYTAFDRLAFVVKEIASLVDTPVRIAHDVASLVDDALLLIVPDDEAAMIDELDVRDVLERDREQPIIIMLERDGQGAQRLPFAPHVASMVAGRHVDPDALAELDVVAERAAFEEQHGMTPEAYLNAWWTTHDSSCGAPEAYYRAFLLADGT